MAATYSACGRDREDLGQVVILRILRVGDHGQLLNGPHPGEDLDALHEDLLVAGALRRQVHLA